MKWVMIHKNVRALRNAQQSDPDSIMVSSAFYRGSTLEATWQSHGKDDMETSAEFKVKINNRVHVRSVELLLFSFKYYLFENIRFLFVTYVYIYEM